jgi:hypothetical protein
MLTLCITINRGALGIVKSQSISSGKSLTSMVKFQLRGSSMRASELGKLEGMAVPH